MLQLGLLDTPSKKIKEKKPPKQAADYDPIELLRNGAHLVLSISGGKDSDAMSHYLLDLREREGWTGEVHFVHADLGRSEWTTTPKYVEEMAARKGVRLHIVRRTAGDLIERIWQRWEAVKHEKCPWPSSANRYCTSDLKRGPIDVWIRNYFPKDAVVICAAGLRADESTNRAKEPVVSVRTDCTAPTLNRLTLNWLPIHKWTAKDVWDCINTLGGGIHHPAYAVNPVTGLKNSRLSCALCILGSDNDLLNGAISNPDTYREMCRIEAVTGYSFKTVEEKGVMHNWWLSDLKPELLPEETLKAVTAHKARVA